jgi:DNA adenine methylase
MAGRSYHEPFLGGGTLFWHLLPRKAFLSDANADLINCYKVIKDHPEKLIELLNFHKERHTSGVLPETYYNSVRNSFNANKGNFIGSAANFIYLNKTCFNGLYRVNGSGKFNVPMGDYKNPLICDEQRIRACTQILNDSYWDIELGSGNYKHFDEKISSKSMVYFDPPYEPVSKTSSFTGYGKNGFTINDQENLKAYCDELTDRGVKWMLSNSNAPLVLDLYKNYRIELVDTQRSISAKSETRGTVKEIIVRNY